MLDVNHCIIDLQACCLAGHWTFDMGSGENMRNNDDVDASKDLNDDMVKVTL